MQDTKKFYPVKGFEDYYEITKCGLVRRKENSIFVNGKLRIKKPNIIGFVVNNKGYKKVLISVKELNFKKRLFLHRLLATTFIENPNNYPFINHINSNTLDNNISNLQWCDQSMNVKHSYDTGRRVSAMRKLKEEDVKYIYLNTIKSRGYNNKKENSVPIMAEKFNIDTNSIYNILNDKSYLNVTKNLKRKEQ